ncbi:MAG TPA: amidohydrolase [Anaerolineae bacterium]|nr:amidohydrolase [Anaerolineae bacterium]
MANSISERNGVAIRQANIITMNPSQPRVQALAVRDGRIAAVGAWEEVAPYAEGLLALDLDGKTVLPGFIDTHTHFLWTALSLAALDTSPAWDHDALQAIIRQAITAVSPGELVFGMGFSEYALDTEKFTPILDALDAVAPDNPVFLVGITGHVAAANSRALELLVLPDDTPGVKRDSRGHPTGLLADQANNLAWEQFSASFGATEKAAGLVSLAVDKALSVGLTTVHALEGSLGGEDRSVADLLAAIPGLPLRFVLYYQTMDVDRVVALGLPRIGGCILLDGDFDPRTAALSEPYVDDPNCNGTLYHTQEEIDAFVLAAHRAGLQVAMHAVGDAAVEQALNAYEAALAVHPRHDHRHRIEHCEVIREEQIQRAQRLGVALAIQPPFNYYWPHTGYYSSLGEERAWRVDPVRTLVRPGLLVAGGSDSTVTPLGPLLGVYAAVNHSNPSERIGVQEAMELYTSNAARIAFEEHDKGSLEVGKLGDLVVLAEDPFRVIPDLIKDIDIEMTIIGGVIAYQKA